MSEIAKVKDKEKGMHDGHRKRLIDLVDRVGIDNVTKIQALEFVLFYIFPRGDVNPLAHRLLDRFGTISTVLEASVEDIMQVKGMAETSAKKLRSLLEVFFYYSQEKLADKDTLKTTGDFYDYIEMLLRYRPEEELFLFGLTPMGEVTKGRSFGKGTFNMVNIELKDITLYVSTFKVKSLILVHNHPKGSCVASTQDVNSFERLKRYFSFSGYVLVDSVIVGTDGIYSMASASKKRLFNVGLEYVQKLLPEDLQEKKTETPQ